MRDRRHLVATEVDKLSAVTKGRRNEADGGTVLPLPEP
jgi:hypothetical protein